MHGSRFGPKLIGTFSLVLVLMTFAIGATAQAETGAKWTYIHPPTSNLLTFTVALQPVVQMSAETEINFQFTTGGGTKVSIKCGAMTLVGEPKLLENGGISESKSKYTKCETFLNGVLSAACLPKTSGAANDEIVTNGSKGLLELHTLIGGVKHHVILHIPNTKNAKGETLAATIIMGEECSIGETVPLTGSFVLYDCEGKLLTHQVIHLTEEFPGLRLLRALGQPVTVAGSFFEFLIGAHLNYKWAGLTA